MDRLDAERRVLETEARRGGGSFAGTASARFGARGAGVIDWPELGIRGLTGEAVEAWARDRFTAGQAVGWMTRPPSDALRLPLSAGDRLPIPAAEPLTALRTPSHITSDEHFVGCSMLAPRSMPLYIAIQLFLSRGFSRLRTELGLAYTVSQSADRISGTDSLFLLFSDAAEGEGPRVLGTFCDVLEDLSSGTLTAEDVSRAHERAMPWNATDQTRPQREAARKATASLLGHAPTTWAQLAEQGAALTADAVQEAMRGALDTAILVVPEGMRVPERFASRPYEPEHRPRFGTLYVRWDANPHDQISLNDRGVTRQVGRSIWSANFADVEALLLGPDGSVWLVRRDGVGVLIEPNQLMRGRELASTLQERLLDRVVDLRGDVIAWFEMQNLLESHDPSVIQSIWQEIEILAQQRRPHERVLAIALADLDGHRGVFAVTDQRFIHVAANRPEPAVWAHRGDIVTVETSTGIRGGRLQIHVRERGNASVDRIRPRGHAAELAALLTPITDPSS